VRAEKARELRERLARDGFISISGFCTASEIIDLRAAYLELERDGAIQRPQGFASVTDEIVLLHRAFAAMAFGSKLRSFVAAILGSNIELQHAKVVSKPLRDEGEGRFRWHQDFAFLPHTNFDLWAIGIHLDDEGEDSGPVRVIPGSHRCGPLSHCRGGEFAYECTEKAAIDADRAVSLVGKAGGLTIHHCLLLHGSLAKRTSSHRRIFFMQVRRRDAAQLAGPIWRCSGLAMSPARQPGRARFPDGTSVEVRGERGRLYDPFGRLAPDIDTPRTLGLSGLDPNPKEDRGA
jgi:hypothetical protein